MAVVELPPTPAGDRRRKTVSSSRYDVAVKKLRELRRQVADNGGDIPTSGMTVAAWLTYWVEHIAAPRLRPKTLDSYRDDVRLHIIPAVGRHRLDNLTPAHVRSMAGEITGKGRSSTTALRCHVILSKALSDAMREGLVHRNVADKDHVDKPRRAASTRGALTAAQGIALLQSVADSPLGSRWAAALLTGARQGELLGLERSRVTDVLDLSWQLQRLRWRHGCGGTCGLDRASACPRREIEVPAGFEHRPLTGLYVLTRPKTKTGTRVVPLVEPLRSILARHIAATDGGPHGLVWTTATGTPIDATTDGKAWHAALEAAGLPSVPLHAARHTTATLLLEAGVDERVRWQILGHSSAASASGYLHVDQTMATDAMLRLSRALGAAT
jgi:integrase